MSISYRSPESDHRRLLTLRQVSTIAAADAAAGREYIRPTVVADIDAMLAQLEKAVEALNDALAARKTAVAAKDSAIQFLEWAVRDGWESMKRRARRQELGTAVLAFYGLPESGDVPAGTAQRDWLQYALGVLDGDPEAAAAGYAPLKDPDVAEIQALYATAQTAYDAVPLTDREYDLKQEAVAVLRQPVDDLLARAVRDIRYNAADAGATKESERRIMRSYGFTFRNDDSAPEEVVDETLADPIEGEG